ncbi:MAG: nitrogen regulation protein NR(II) [Planctomycetota bacterium]
MTDTYEKEGERGRALEALREREARLLAIFDNAVECIVTIDGRGIIESVNPAAEQAFGYRTAEIAGQNVSMLMPSPYRDEHDEYLRRYLDTGEKRIIGIGREVVGQRKDGSTFPVHISVSEFTVGGRQLFTGILRDISEQTELRAKLAQSERLAAVGELAAGVAHEVSNPINTIINCAQLLKDGDPDSSLIDDILHEGGRVSSIVGNLLSFARNDDDGRHPVDLGDILQQTIGLIGRRLNQQGIQIKTRIPIDLPPVVAHPNQIQQVFLNLFLNARDALLGQSSASKMSIHVWAGKVHRPARPAVRFCVHDNGPGIPAEIRDRIFEPFFTTKRGRGGTGLGLSIVKNIVENHAGSLEVTSAKGEFTEFQVTLPAHDERRTGR